MSTPPKALVLRTGGTNCEEETARALALGGAEVEILHTDRLIEQPARIEAYRILVFAGGFSYGDDLAAGRVWGLELRTSLGEALRAHVERGGLMLGVCNGFQALVEAGLFEPERSARERDVALYANASDHYECRWVELEAHPSRCLWLRPGERLPCPVAHAEGRLVVRDSKALAGLYERGQVALTYVGEGYPANPNGSVDGIAGICDPTGQVLGLMPHPERNLDPWNHPDWTRRETRREGEGLEFYRSLVRVAASGEPVG